MRHILFTLLILTGFRASAQVTIEAFPGDSVCFRDSVALIAVVEPSVAQKDLTYQWQKNLLNIPGAVDSIFSIKSVKAQDQGLYGCILFVDGVATDTAEMVLYMHPRMYIDTLRRYNPLGCYSECKGQFKTNVSGGSPYSFFPQYIYEWGGGKSLDTLVLGLCPGYYKFKVSDSMGCFLDSTYYVDALKSPKVEIKFDPKDTIYITNPYITVSFPDSMRQYITNWTWDFRDSTRIENQNPATHIYEAEGDRDIRLLITDNNGCDTIYEKTLTVKIAKLKIPNVFTPNGDNINDTFEVILEGEPKTKDYRQAYLGTELAVYDRWGRKVYGGRNYESGDWDGGHLSDGVYYYVLQCTGQWKDETYRGSVTILHGNN